MKQFILNHRTMVRERFRASYGEHPTEVVDEIERAVIGADFGANGYTTRRQADLLATELDLAPGVDLLDIGAGRGWPGLYLAIHTGCRTVLTDVPVEGLQGAIGREEREGVSHRVSAVAASARHLPFPPRTFDAVVHTDVLC